MGENRYWPVIFLASVDLVCVFEAGDSFREHHWEAGVVWLALGAAFSLIGYYWPQIKVRGWKRKPAPTLPEHRPNVVPTDYGENVERNAFGLFVRNPGYDALEVRIPEVPLGSSAYRLVFSEIKPVVSERDHIVFFEAYLEDQTSGLPGLDGSRLHDVMRLSDVEMANFTILYKGTDFFEYQTNCVIERVNWKHNGLTVRTVGQERGKSTP